MTREIDANCPECGYRVDDASSIQHPGARPSEGDLAVCIQCAGLGIYVLKENEALGLRLLTTDEKVELSQNPAVMETRTLIAASSIWFTP